MPPLLALLAQAGRQRRAATPAACQWKLRHEQQVPQHLALRRQQRRLRRRRQTAHQPRQHWRRHSLLLPSAPPVPTQSLLAAASQPRAQLLLRPLADGRARH